MSAEEKLDQLKIQFDKFFRDLNTRKNIKNQKDSILELKLICFKRIDAIRSEILEKKKKVREHILPQENLEKYVKKINKDFESKIIRSYILDFVEHTSKDKRNELNRQFKDSKVDVLLNFIYGLKGSHSITKDICALCLGKDGYNDFARNIMPIPKLKQVKEVSPTHENFVTIFFKNDCYLYVYSEDIGKPDESTAYKNINFPEIDVIVLKYNTQLKLFSIDNVDKRINHNYGTLSWVGSDNREAFDIQFPDSERSLNLRLQVPKIHINKNIHQILLGSFSYVDDVEGNIVIGSVVIRNFNKKEENGRKLSPYKYKFNLDSTEQIKEPDENVSIPPISVQKYLFDRYRNWIKIKGGIYNLNKLEDWVNKKEKKDYTRRKITQYKYFVTCPVTSFEDDENLKGKIAISLSNTFSNFKKYYRETAGVLEYLKEDPEHETIDDLVGTIDNNLNNDREKIHLFPLNKKNIRHGDKSDLNRSIFKKINQSVSVVIIIPGGEVKYKKVSSVYTIAGYSIAMRKKTFILHQDETDMPLVLMTDMQDMGVHVHTYECIEEIPFIFYYINKYNSKYS